ncbi:MAG TPA: hypothetical protein VKW76_05485 [Candidatus Binatia bacterium]|nr:hypothetical protein [Candidatus Binatia bacterium]
MSAVLATTRGTLAELLQEADRRGWLRTEGRAAVIQVARRHRTAAVIETARALAGFLAERSPGCRIDPPAERTLRVAGVAMSRGVAVPALWFEPIFLVTVCGVGADGFGRLAGPLAAQAEALAALDGRAGAADCVYEAHRLAASDLVVACGEGWCALSPSDVALEQALAAAAGLAWARVPYFRALVRHELVAEPEPVGGELPDLRACVGSAWRARLAAAAAAARATARGVADDAAAFRRNLRRIPHAVRRRLPALSRRRSAA